MVFVICLVFSCVNLKKFNFQNLNVFNFMIVVKLDENGESSES